MSTTDVAFWVYVGWASATGITLIWAALRIVWLPRHWSTREKGIRNQGLWPALFFNLAGIQAIPVAFLIYYSGACTGGYNEPVVCSGWPPDALGEISYGIMFLFGFGVPLVGVISIVLGFIIEILTRYRLSRRAGAQS